MSWQRGSERPDPRASDVDADHRLATGPRRLQSEIHRVTSRVPRRRLIAARLSLGGGILVRRVAIATLSGLLLMASVFLPFPEDSPSYALDLTSDAVQSMASPPPEALSGSRRHLPSLLKQMAAPALDPLPSWVQNPRTTNLWAASKGSDAPILSLKENTFLKVLGRPENDRLPVYYEGTGPDGTKRGGWLDLGDVVPSSEPPARPAEATRAAPTSRGGARPTPDISTQEKFITAVAEAAQDSNLDSRVPASVTIAQAILESDWGKSLLAKKGQNYFGIKAGRAGPGPAGVINMNTWEVLGGANVTVNDGFKAYHNLYESVMDHGRFLADNSRYASAFEVTDNSREFARRIHAAGYATDPAYTTKLVNLMNKFNLYQYDLKP
ncbi:MAG: glucosaminidase domain-containing protein [Chloroflexota bacterium]